MDYSTARQKIIDLMRKQLIGPAMDGNLRGMSPLRRYPMGVLYPTVETGEGLYPASEDDYDTDQDDFAGGVERDTESTAEGVVRRRYIPPSSVGFSFYVHGFEWEIQVIFSAVIYRQEKFEGRFTNGYARTELGGDESALIVNGPRRIGVFHYSDSNNEEEQNLAGIDIQARKHDKGTIITVSMYNAQEMPADVDLKAWHNEQLQRSLFEVELKCVIEKGEVGNYPRVDFSLLDHEDQELELQYKSRKIYAVGHGCAVDWSIEEKGIVNDIRSEFMPVMEVPQVTADLAEGKEGVFNLAFLAESVPNRAAVCNGLRDFVSSYGAWVAERERDLTQLEADERLAGQRIVNRMKSALGRMKAGIRLIESDTEVARAFALANQAMLDQMQQAGRIKGGTTDSSRMNWRPFQLAFLLTTLTSAIDENDDFRDTVDLIWFPTGGGKTEAYLGLIAFLMLWRRLRFPDTGGGTTSLMRYTYRLLTAQQYLRATRMICALELIRRQSNGELGEEPFSVGLWVGTATSPNTFEKARQCIEMAAQGRRKALAGLVLDSCPWCGREFQVPQNFRATSTVFQFLCRNADCAFGADGQGVLPCNIVDEALYQNPPSLLIATIDKFARLAWEERAGSFFGVGKNRPPELIVQDELHLISGTLGSVAGVYEAALETVLVQRGIYPKLVASTATIRMAEDQIKRLYGKEVAVFPPPGMDCDDSFFARTVPTDVRPGRMYVGYFAPMLPRRKNMAPLAAALLAAPEVVFEQGEADRDELLEAWWTQVIYHGSLRGVGNSHNSFNIDVREWFERLKKEAEQRKRTKPNSDIHDSEAYNADNSRHEANAAIERGRASIAQLTGIASAEENSRTFARLAFPRTHPECIDAVLATNMLSVGLDVGRLALMIINGQPLTTAEYIQASSRVGRSKVPGIVFINYYRDQARSLSHYENFRPYHESFYRFVEPTSITPYTYQARIRALHAGLVISLRHTVSALLENKKAWKFVADDTVIARVITDYKKRCTRADPSRKNEIERHIDALVQEWQQYAENCKLNCRQLSYHARDNDRSVDRLLFSHGDKIRGLWPTLHSMRNVENMGLLKAL